MRKLLFLVLPLTLSILSCTKDDPNNPSDPSGETNKAIKLNCRYDGDFTLKNHRDGVDYTADCLVEIFDGTLKIEPGVTVEFGINGGISTSSTGFLASDGTSGDEITLKSASSQGWIGIYLDRSNGTNTLSHTNIINAGQGDGFFSFRKEPAAITVAGKLAITDCTIENSNGVGIISRDESGESTIQKLEDVVLKNCKTFPIKSTPANIAKMDLTSCKYEENGENYVVIDTKSKDRLNSDLTLQPIDIPYLLSSSIYLYAGLTIEAGVDLVMDSNVELQCRNSNKTFLNIAGTQSKHVTIRGKESISGYWKGIHVLAPNVKNIFEYLDISDAGSEVLGWEKNGANIVLGNDGKLVLNNCTSARSFTSCDLSVYAHTGTPTLTNNSPELKVCE